MRVMNSLLKYQIKEVLLYNYIIYEKDKIISFKYKYVTFTSFHRRRQNIK